jgi:VIT family
MTTPGRSSIAQKYLDPASSLGEVMFGLIMTLTFTLAAGVIIEDEGREGARQLLIAIIGCNIAWGIIDGALYMMGELFGRGRLRNVGRMVREESDDRAAEALVAGEVNELLEPVTTDAERSDLYRRIVRNIRSMPGRTTGITKADILGALASFWLVFLASLPAAIPFLFMDDARLALRVSNAILVLLLFFIGYRWSRYTLGKPWLVGLCFLIIGIVLVAIAIPLGG